MKVRHARDVAWLRDPRDGQFVYIARLPDGPVHILDEIAGLIWSSIDGGEVAELVATVESAAGVWQDRVEADVRGLVDRLVTEGFVEVL